MQLKKLKFLISLTDRFSALLGNIQKKLGNIANDIQRATIQHDSISPLPLSERVMRCAIFLHIF